MRIKQGLAVVLLGLILVGRPLPLIFGQQRDPRDLILLLDTSAPMSGYYREVNKYLSGSFLQDNLRLGDTFHLIAFSDKPRMEIARRVEGRGDLETVIGRMLLLYPLDPPPDLPAALSFVENYALGLESPRQKKIVLLSLENGSLETLAGETRVRLAGQNIGFEYVKAQTLPKAPPQTTQRPTTPVAPSAQRPATPQTPTAPPPQTTQRPATPVAPSAQSPATPATPSQTAQRPVTPQTPTAAPSREAQRPAAPTTTPSQAAQLPATSPTPNREAQRPATPTAPPSQTTQRPVTPQTPTAPSREAQPPATPQASGQEAQRPATPAAPSREAQPPATSPTPNQEAQSPATPATTPGQTTQRPVTPQTPTAAPSREAQRPATPTAPPSQTTQRPVAPQTPKAAPSQEAQRPATPTAPPQATQRPATPATPAAPSQTTQRPVTPQTPTAPSREVQPPATPQASGQEAQSPATPATTPGQTAQRPATPAAPSQTIPRPAKPPENRRIAARGLALINDYKQGILGVLILAILGLGAFFLVRHLHRTPNRAVARAAAAPRKKQTRELPRANSASPKPASPYYSRPRRESPYKDTYKAPRKIEYGSPLMLKLFVADQNTFIGKRNTHLVKPGLSYTVGGGRSDFLIFLVQVPPHIGELRYENSGCSFYPRRPEYFPDTGGEPVQDCIGKTIRIVSDKGYDLFIRIEQYEDPLIELNRLMHSIKVPSALDT